MKFRDCRNLIILLCALIEVHGRGIVRKDCVCGEANIRNSGRIVNGVTATRHKYPWVAGMFHGDLFICGGAVISDKNILTAGHCYYYVPEPYQTFWVLGMHDQRYKDGRHFPIDDFQIHPKFKNFTVYDDYDMSLVKLKMRILFNYAIKPICLNLPNDDYVGMRAIVAGWGRLSDNSPIMGAQLQETAVRVKKPEECEMEVARLMRFNNNSMICAYEKGTDSCNGDSGGPLFIETHPNRHEVIGLVSFGDGCARAFPGIYTKTANADTQRWIKKYMIESDANICSDPGRKITERFFDDFL